MSTFTSIFIAAIVLTTMLRLWLSWRHIRHIGQHRGQVPDAFASQIPLADHQKAADYTQAKTRLGMISTLIDAGVLLVFTLGGGIEALHQFWLAELGQTLWQGIAMLLSVSFISSLIGWPLSMYATFVIEARFGFNRTTLATYITDLIKQSLLGLALGIPLLYAVLWLMGKMGDHWWLYVWVVWTAFQLVLLAVYPTWIAPLFNKFSPLEEGPIKARIEALLTKCGFTSNGLFMMDGSKRSAHGNAYFTGFGKSKRIVFFDTLLTQLEPAEIEAVLAHELGHFKHRHIIKRIVWSFFSSLAMFYVLGVLMQQPWFYQGLGVASQGTALALLLFFIAAPVFLFPLTPLGSLYSRKHEFEADRYAAAQADAKDLISALVKMYRDNASTLTPDPLHSTFYDSHPPASIRIAHLQAQQI
ncbi:STE24 endopeptidase [Chitinivorax tropicus]|uniref:STE24 endopeptidase n=1 Tax=Chitinivorax tropicus TaxID=714531 RepID=A0A840MW88_9PROT|nr:M48 family metallopeptidase [Chitinivorax tropicus]MBB5019431.1 STE24 endopeptidase [Chitinivorax tropicus]